MYDDGARARSTNNCSGDELLHPINPGKEEDHSLELTISIFNSLFTNTSNRTYQGTHIYPNNVPCFANGSRYPNTSVQNFGHPRDLSLSTMDGTIRVLYADINAEEHNFNANMIIGGERVEVPPRRVTLVLSMHLESDPYLAH